MKAKVSIIIPCYNVEEYVEECLQSVLGQTYGLDNIEIILVDDCSTDKTLEVVRKYEQQYPENIGLILSNKNGKQGTARNIGLQYVTGDYILFVDSDDWIEKHMVEKLVELAEKHLADLVQFRYSSEKEEVLALEYPQEKVYLYDDENVVGHIMNSNILNESCTTKLYRRAFLEKAGVWFAEGVCYEEPLFTYPLKFYAHKVCVIEKPFYFYRENPKGTMLSTMNGDTTILQHLEVQMRTFLWVKERGFFDRFPREITFYFIHTILLEPLLFYAGRGKVLPPEIFRFASQKMDQLLPEYASCFYLHRRETEKETKAVELSTAELPLDSLRNQMILFEKEIFEGMENM